MTDDFLAANDGAWVALDRYLAGSASADERASVEQWLAEDAGAVALVAELREMRAGPGAPATFATADVARRIERGIDSVEHKTRRPAPGTSLPRQEHRRRWVSWSVLGVVTAGLLLPVVFTGRDTSRASAMQTFTTRAGQRATVTLQSGARATLGPMTRLDVTTGVSRNGIVADVQGQVVFVVAPDVRTPFVVRTRTSVTRVLGTTFAVRQYAADRAAELLVSEGRVAFGARLASSVLDNAARKGRESRAVSVLGAGMRGVVGDSGLVHVTPNVSPDELAAWTTGTLVFRKTPVRNVVDELGRAYGVTVRLADTAVATRPLTWTVPTATQSLADALGELVVLLDAHVTWTKSGVTIVPGRHAPQKSVAPNHPFSSETEYGR